MMATGQHGTDLINFVNNMHELFLKITKNKTDDYYDVSLYDGFNTDDTYLKVIKKRIKRKELTNVIAVLLK